MDWLQALLLGLVQGLTEFLPVSSSGHLMIFKELLGVDAEGFLDFTVTVHLATVLSTVVVFWKPYEKIDEETGEITKHFYLRYYNVFHLDQEVGGNRAGTPEEENQHQKL